MPTPSSYPPEPSLDAIGGRATFDGYVVRLERWGREADRRRCAYAAAPIGSVRGARVMTTPTAQEQAPAATTEPETDAAPQSQPAQSDDSQSQSQSTDTDSGTHDDGRNQMQEGESDVSGAEGSQAGQ